MERPIPAERESPVPSRRPRPRRSARAVAIRIAKLVFWSAAALALTATAGLIWVFHLADGMPEVAWIEQEPRRTDVIVLDRYGAEIAPEPPRTIERVDVATLPEHLIDAVLAVEDRRFYEHHGVDVRGLARAAFENLRAGEVVQGGSTLTQQLAKNIILDSERTLRRKLRELLLAHWIERRYSKDEILGLYLARVYFGAGAWGVEAASQRYFGKPASDVTLGEAALLAGLLKAPSRYSPTNSVARAEARATVVLELMAQTGAITAEELYEALATPLHVRAAAPVPQDEDGGGWFADWVSARARELVSAQSQTLVVRTTLDLRAQAAAERAVTRGLAGVEDRGADQAALVALDGDGAVRAMVGGRSYAESQFNRAVYAARQPGSAFKPFVYAAAIEAGLSPWTVRSDAPVVLGDWSPTNFDDEFNGDMALIDALARSVNTVAVRVAEEIGRERIVRLVKRLGLDSRIRATRSMALGSHEVTPIELTATYAAFANGGYAVEPYAITSIENAAGQVLWRRPVPETKRGLDARTAALMNLMLARVVTDGTGRASALPDRPSAGKTGTTNDFRDAWFIGYVPGFVAGVWVGADDFSPMARMTGGALPARIWRDFMAQTLEGEPAVALETEPPAGATPVVPVAEAPSAREGTIEDVAREELEALLARIEGPSPTQP